MTEQLRAGASRARLTRRALIGRVAGGLTVGAGGLLLLACSRGGPATPTPSPAGTPATPGTATADATATRASTARATGIGAPPGATAAGTATRPPATADPATPTRAESPTAAASPTAARAANPTAARSDVGLRVIHAAPGVPEVTLAVDGRQAFTLRFTDASAYQALPPGERRLQIFPGAGTGAAPLAETTPTLRVGQSATLVVVGAPGQVEALLLPDDLTPPANGTVHVRVLHAAPDGPAVDVALQGGATLARNAAFRSVSGYTPIPAGAAVFETRLAGSNDVLFATRSLALDSGEIYTATVLGLNADNTLRMLVYPDNA